MNRLATTLRRAMSTAAASKTVIVTGASSGIGKASAIELSKAGWNVVLTARREQELREVAKECPGETLVVPGNITDPLFVKSLFTETLGKFGEESYAISRSTIDLGLRPPRCSLQCVFFACCLRSKLMGFTKNAGILGPQVPIDEVELADFSNVINVNLTASFLCTQEAVKAFKAQEPQGGAWIL